MAVFVALVLVITLGQVVERPAVAVAGPVQPLTAVEPQVLERPDRMSALITARMTGRRVRISGMTSGTAEYVALPEGQIEAQLSAGVVRLRRGDGWVPVDLTLREQPDGSIAAVADPHEVRLSGARSGGGVGELAGVGVGAGRLSLGWSGPLAAPVLSGNRATYPEALPGVDLVVEVSRDGVETFLIVKSAAAVDRVRAVRFPVSGKKVASFKRDAGGNVTFVDAAGRTVATSAAPAMWDASSNAKGGALALRTKVGSTVRRTAARSGTPAAVELALTPDADWLSSSDRVFPITIDPSITIGSTTFDTYVKDGDTADRSGENAMMLGRAGGANPGVARSFTAWNVSALRGHTVTSATTSFWNYYAPSCAGKAWQIWTTGAVNSSTRWTNQPTWDFMEGESTATRGFDASCDDGWINMTSTNFFNRAAQAQVSTAYMGIRAKDETDLSAWKELRTNHTANANHIPTTTVTYNASAGVPARATVPSTTCVIGSGRPFINTTTPQFKAQVTDPEGAQVSANYEWYVTNTTNRLGSSVQGPGASGSWLPPAVVPAGQLANGGTYSWRVQGLDGLGYGRWASWCEFTVDTTAPATAPTVSSSNYLEGSWSGGAGTAASFTFGASGVADVASYEYDLDVNPPAQSVNATALGAGASVSVPVPNDGPHTLYVRAVDRAGNRSPTKAYVFNAGAGGVTAPGTGDITAAKAAITTVAAPAVTSVTYQWRRGDADAWTTIPAANVTKAVGGGAVTWPLPTTGGGQFEKLNWDVAKTLNDAETGPDPLDGPFQLRALFNTGAGSSAVALTFDKNNSSAATSSVGPCAVNLITGNCGLDDSDVSVDSYGTDLTVTRSFNTRQPAKTDTANMFGPGWVSSAIVEDSEAPYTSLTRTGSLVQVGLPEGDTIGFGKKGAITGGESFTPEVGMEDLKLTYTSASDSYTLSDQDGNVATFTRVSGAPAGLYNPTAVTVPGSGQTTTLSWQSATVAGATVVRPTRMLAPVPNGVTCTAMVRGCRALNLTYATTTTATGTAETQWGDYTGRVKEITFTAWDPDLSTPAMRTIAMARYAYDNTGKLRASWDPRLDWTDTSVTRHLWDRYAYNADGTLAWVLPNAEPGWRLNYTTVPADSGAGRLASASRAAAVIGPTGAGPIVSAIFPGTAEFPGPGRLCADIESSGTANGTTIKTFNCNGTGAQNWAFHSDGTIRGLGKCLSVSGNSTANNALIVLWTCDGSPGQQWRPTDNGTLVNPNSGKCLDNPNSSPWPGTQLQISTCGTGVNPAQDWTTSLSTVVYRVPTSGTGAAYDLSGTQTARWGQTEPPTDAAAVYPATQIPTGNQGAGTAPDSYERATVTYLDANARQVNTAQPGGNITATWYDRYGNTIRELTAANREAALDASGSDNAGQEADLAKIRSTLSTYSADGQRLTDTWSPEHDTMLADGSIVSARTRTRSVYDEGAPNGGPYNLVTTQVVSACYGSGACAEAEPRVTKTEYDWTLRQPTKVTQDHGGLNLATRTSYDSVTGLVLATTAPRGGTVDTTPSTRKTTFYRSTSGSGYTECDSKPEWANLTCRTEPGGQPGSGPELPATITTYDIFNQPRVVTEKISTGTLRTTTTTYDAAGRGYERTVTAAAGLGTGVPKQRTVYDQATGRATRTQSIDSGGSVTAQVIRQYDAYGRQTSYTDADGTTSTTTYDMASRPATTNDGKTTRTYTYDGGNERRGLVTGISDGQAGAFAASYDADGNLTTQTWPTGTSAGTSYDSTGTATALTYNKPGCGQADCTLYTETITENTHGQWRQHASTLSGQNHTYDNAGRLTTVEDTVNGECTTRAYGYDNATNRTSTTTYAPDSGGTCQITSPSASTTKTFDAADRITTGGTGYDALGRTTTVAAEDTTNAGGGQITVSYHHTNLVRSITQGSRSTIYTLDVTKERIRTWTDNAQGIAVTATHHYDSDDDNPAWTQETGNRYTRAISSIDGLVGIYDSDDGEIDWQLSNLHGDLVVTVVGTANGISSAHEATEYGDMRSPTDTGNRRYGWLGAKQRAADTPAGIVLMGVRLYNSATARFLSVDPVEGGSCNAYEYACGDPVNKEDLDGKKAKWLVRACQSFKNWCARGVGNLARLYSRGSQYGINSFLYGAFRVRNGLARAGSVIRKTSVRCLRFPNAGGFGCDLRYGGTRKFGIHYHRSKNGKYRPHYHRRPGIGKHRPWEGGW
ncbi:ricin-type beta-trefoil lectin domain protein [Asanoa hainanensis]|nr:ricin-type beta-trefoil lectin domain protein [Asanoa hainanensis]